MFTRAYTRLPITHVYLFLPMFTIIANNYYPCLLVSNHV